MFKKSVCVDTIELVFLNQPFIYGAYNGIALVGRPSVCLPVSPFVRKHFQVDFPSLITRQN